MRKRKGGFFRSFKFKLILLAIFLVFVLLLMIAHMIQSIMSAGKEKSDSDPSKSRGGYSATIESYRPLVTKLCDEYNTKPESLDLTKFVNCALAVIEIESNGLGNDPMQSSECGYNKEYPNKPNAIQDPEYSLRCGIQYMRDALIKFGVKEATDYDLMASAIQGYNFGIDGWYKWIKENNDCKYTVEMAKKYSAKICSEKGLSSYGTATHGEKFLKAYKKGTAPKINGKGSGFENMVLYYQWDSRWNTYPYGTSTIQSSGCGITCMAMCLATFCDSSIEPPEIADISMKNGGYVTGLGSSMPNVVLACSKLYDFNYANITSKQIEEYVTEKNALIIWGCKGVNESPTGFFSKSNAGHVMLIRDVQDDKYFIADPNNQLNNDPNCSFELSFIEQESKGYYIAIWEK